jgi:hypothetical protein
MKVRLCPQCKSINGSTVLNCDGCGATLSMDTIVDLPENAGSPSNAQHVAATPPQYQKPSIPPHPNPLPRSRYAVQFDQALAFLQRANPGQRWEYTLAECTLHKEDGYYLYAINNEVLTIAIQLHVFLEYMGEKGWELVGTTRAERSIEKRSVSLNELFRGDTSTLYPTLVLIFRYPLP